MPGLGEPMSGPVGPGELGGPGGEQRVRKVVGVEVGTVGAVTGHRHDDDGYSHESHEAGDFARDVDHEKTGFGGLYPLCDDSHSGAQTAVVQRRPV